MCVGVHVCVCVCGAPTLRIKGVMFSLRQLKVVAVLGTWDPCLSAGIGMEPAAPLRARCCFIYLKAQVTFLEERRSETCLRGLSAPPHFSSVTYLPVKGEIECHQRDPSPLSEKQSRREPLYFVQLWYCLLPQVETRVGMFSLKIAPFDSEKGKGYIFWQILMVFDVGSFWTSNWRFDSPKDWLPADPACFEHLKRVYILKNSAG